MENYIWEDNANEKSKKFLTLIIYDITDNKRRIGMVKFLEKYGHRVQKSAFEAFLEQRLFNKLKKEIPLLITEDDSVKIYRLKGVSETYTFGEEKNITDEEWILI